MESRRYEGYTKEQIHEQLAALYDANSQPDPAGRHLALAECERKSTNAAKPICD
jgi:hypothetical protein